MCSMIFHSFRCSVKKNLFDFPSSDAQLSEACFKPSKDAKECRMRFPFDPMATYDLQPTPEGTIEFYKKCPKADDYCNGK